MAKANTYVAITLIDGEVSELDFDESLSSAIFTATIGEESGDPIGSFYIVVQLMHTIRQARVVYMRQSGRKGLLIGPSNRGIPQELPYQIISSLLGDVRTDPETWKGDLGDFIRLDAKDLLNTLDLMPRTKPTSKHLHDVPKKQPHGNRDTAKPTTYRQSPGGCLLILMGLCVAVLLAFLS